MATLSTKPSERYQLSDWHTNSYLLSTNAERQREASYQIRQEARALRNETNNQTIWDEQDNQARLAERIDAVNRMKEKLDKCLTDLDAEIDALAQIKESAEQNLQAKNLPLDVAIECLTLRESRRDIDVVVDTVEQELHKEVAVIEAARAALQSKITLAFEKLCLLQEVRQQLNTDHRDKMEALDIDRGCLSLNLQSPNLSLKTNPTRVPENTSSLQQWDEFSQFIINRAETEMKQAVELREAVVLTIAETNNELEAQRVATEFTFRKRLREVEKLFSELKWQEKNTMEELTDLKEDIRRLEDDLHRKMLNLKLCHTRLESRTYRPNVELCQDQGCSGQALQAPGPAASRHCLQGQHPTVGHQVHGHPPQADGAC
ncbi:tektin-2 isoform X3 [Sorex araneus]|uniref:tektin-2 isoform X3 n=1 Tax=Sorex araneus TaxID=42254 RepID=UPI002433606A|nr:tektin-2 isoform X3 [Sorex araneus]